MTNHCPKKKKKKRIHCKYPNKKLDGGVSNNLRNILRTVQSETKKAEVKMASFYFCFLVCRMVMIKKKKEESRRWRASRSRFFQHNDLKCSWSDVVSRVSCSILFYFFGLFSHLSWYLRPNTNSAKELLKVCMCLFFLGPARWCWWFFPCWRQVASQPRRMKTRSNRAWLRSGESSTSPIKI